MQIVNRLDCIKLLANLGSCLRKKVDSMFYELSALDLCERLHEVVLVVIVQSLDQVISLLSLRYFYCCCPCNRCRSSGSLMSYASSVMNM